MNINFITIKQIKSTIGRPKKQKIILKTLGLKHIGHTKNIKNNKAMHGMIFKIKHLVKIIT